MTSWDRFPAEIRLMILETVLHNGCNLASIATVSQEWQTVVEQQIFSRIKLTPSRLPEFGAMIHRNRRLVRYIWFCLELEEYDCIGCGPQDSESWGLSDMDNSLIVKSLADLFSILSAWQPVGELTLDISVHSPSDSQHRFNYLTFEPDSTSDTSDEHHLAERQMISSSCNNYHGPSACDRSPNPTFQAINKSFEEIMGEGPFDDDEQERRWWQLLPLVPVVTAVLLRQQTRRRWKPDALAQMFARMPRLQEIHYEPWREWLDMQQRWTDKALQTLFEAPTFTRLRKLILFENFNQAYPASFMSLGCDPLRIPSASVGRALAKASLNLDSLSAAFLVDAVDFFKETRQRCWKWPNLKSLALTTALLSPNTHLKKLDDLLRAAAETAMEMPNLETMELWNGLEGLAMLVKYRRGQLGRTAALEWKGTWEITLRDPVIEAWDVVALRHGGGACNAFGEVISVDPIRSHGDAIRLLGLSGLAIRPVSLRQILPEHTIREKRKSQ